MIEMDDINNAITTGLKDYVQLQHVIRAEQSSSRPEYPFITFKWISIIPERGTLNKTVQTVASKDPEWDVDIEYRYSRNPVMTLSVTVYDKGGSDEITKLVQLAHTWFRIPELASDMLEPIGARVLNTHMITSRDTVLDQEIERRLGFDVRLQATDEVVITVPTIERVVVNNNELVL
ncbi:MAG: hypothetical protein GX986_08005 [Firmicutes bacterium]|nr:hypothetical protein [Bacillota bacterium]